MSAPLPQDNRHLVPRWRSPSDAVRAGEIGGASPQDPSDLAPSAEEARLRRRQFQRAHEVNQGVNEAAFELLAAALAANDRSLVAEAAEVLAASAPDISGIVEMFDQPAALADSSPEIVIGNARRRLRASSRQPLAWLELGRGRLLTGQVDLAEQALRAARQLAPDHRLIVRAEARLYVHRNEHDRAHDLILNHPRTPHDPWLRATEVAVAELAERRSRFVGSSRTGLLAGDWAPKQASELAAAVATAEHLAGDERRARKLLPTAVSGGHDNALAQAQWLVNDGLRMPDLPLDTTANQHIFGFEARARRAYYNGDWDIAHSQGQLWQRDQAFATLPARFLSLVAVVGLADPALSLQAAREGLRVNSDHAVLLNNAAFASLVAGDLAAAEADLLRATKHLHHDMAAGDRAALLATNGLLAYRLGDAEEGKRLYELAAAVAARGGFGLAHDAVHLYHYWARQQSGLDTDGMPHPDRLWFDEPIFLTMKQRVIDRSLPWQPIQTQGSHR